MLKRAGLFQGIWLWSSWHVRSSRLLSLRARTIQRGHLESWTPGHKALAWTCDNVDLDTWARWLLRRDFTSKCWKLQWIYFGHLGDLNLLSTYNLPQRRECQVRPEPGWQLMWNMSDPDSFNTTYSATFLLDMRTYAPENSKWVTNKPLRQNTLSSSSLLPFKTAMLPVY